MKTLEIDFSGRAFCFNIYSSARKVKNKYSAHNNTGAVLPVLVCQPANKTCVLVYMWVCGCVTSGAM